MRRLQIAVALVAALLAVSIAAPAGAGRAGKATELERLRDDYDEVLSEEAHLLAAFEDSQERKAALDLRVAELDQQVLAGQAELAAAEARLLQAEADARVAERQLRRAIRDLERSKDRLQRRAVAAYTGSNSQGQLAGMILSAKNLHEVQVASRYAGAVLEGQRTVIERHAALEEVTRERATAAEQAEDAASAARQLMAERQEQIERARDEQVWAQQALASELEKQMHLLEQVRARKAETERRIAALQVESDSIGTTLRQRQAGQVLVPSERGMLAVPLPGATVGSPFGLRVHPIFGTSRMHNGIDLGGPMGQPILAAAAGEVVVAGERGGYGNAVVIDHGGQLSTLYAHQSRMVVAPGQVVEQGQVIGFVGSTGFSTGPHLHFEVRLSGTPVDPLGYL